MNPLLMQKKDLAMNMTTNVYMNSTTKYVPTPLTLNKPAGSTQKLKDQSFVYQKSPRSNKEKDDAPMKQSFNSNLRSSGIQGTKISDLGSSSLFKGLDGLYNKPIQYTDRRKQQKSQQKQQNDNNKDKDKSGSTYFERRQNNKLADSSVTYGNNNQPNQTGTVSSRLKGPTNEAVRNVNPKVQTDNSQMLIRKPQNRPVTTQEKPKQVQKPQTISRKPQLTNDKTPKQESFTTQTSSYVYMPPNRRGSISSEQPATFKSPDINKNPTPVQKKKEQPVNKAQTRPKLPENIFARDRSRQSKEINLNLEINTDVTYFKIQTRGASSRRSSTENPASRQASTKNSPQKNSVNPVKKVQQPVKPNPYQKLILQKQIQVPKSENTRNSIYQKPKQKADLIKQIQQPLKIETQKTDPQSSVDEKKFVYRPKPAQIQTKQIVKPNQPSAKNQQKVSVDKETSNKPINSSYQYGKKSKEDLIRENQKTELEKPEITTKKPAYVYPGMKKTEDQQKKIESPRNSNLIDNKSPYQNQGISKVQNLSQQNSSIENPKPYSYLNRQNITKSNTVQEQGKVQQKNILNQALKPLQTQQIYKPTYKYSSKNEESKASQQNANNLSQPQKTQPVARYPYAQKPIQTSQRPSEGKKQSQTSQKPQIQKIESPRNQNQPTTKTQQSSYLPVQKQQPIKTTQPIQRQNIEQRPVQKTISQNVVDIQNSPRNTEVSPKPSVQETKVILPTKQNTSGYVYQPPNRRNQNASTQVSTVIQKQKNSQKSIPSSQNVPALSSNKSIPIKNQTPVVSPRKTEQTTKPSQTNQQQIQRTVQNKTQPQNQQSIESPKQPNQNQRKQQVQSPKRQQIKRQQTNSTTNDSRAKPIQNTLTNRPAYNRYQNKVQESIVVTPQPEQTKVQNNRFKRATTVASNPIQNVPEVKTKVQSPRINSVSAINKTQTIKPKPTVTQEIPSNQTEIKKKPIPKSVYSLLNILINKKIKSNIKFSVQKLKNSKQVSLKRQRNLNILAKKYFSLFQNYERFLKFEAFYVLKKVFVSALINTASSTPQNVSGSRVVGLKPLQKSKQLKEDAEYETLKTNMRKVLCLKLNSLFNKKIRSVFQENLIPRFSNNTLSTKKQPIFVALHQLFVKKINANLSNSFKRIKFTYHFVSKRSQDDLLPLYETKNKKMSKQEIAKFFQNLFPIQPIVPSGSRVSLIQKTPEKKQPSLAQSRIPSVKSIQSPTLKAETQKIQSLRSRIETIEKDIHNQQKLASDKQRQLNAKKMQLRKQINAIKKQHETRKKQNQELVDKLKQYENISNFTAENKQSSNILDEAMRQQQPLNEQNGGQLEINYGNNQYLRSLCDLYADHVFKNLSSPELLPHSIDDLLTRSTQMPPLLAEGLNYVVEPFSDGNIKFDEVALTNFQKSRNTIQERLMLEKNLLLKSQISRIEAQFIGESHQTTDSTVCRIQEQVNVFRSLAKNYIKQRYLWQWIRKSIEQN